MVEILVRSLLLSRTVLLCRDRMIKYRESYTEHISPESFIYVLLLKKELIPISRPEEIKVDHFPEFAPTVTGT